MDNIKTNLYSRQISTYGMDTMEKLINMKIIILGIKGLGLEIAKNIILSGPDTVSIFDDNACSISDLSSNFFITVKDINIKKRRDVACLSKLSELNHNVQVNNFESIEILKDNIKNYDILVITEIINSEAILEYNHICRENKKRMIYSSVLGLSGFVFNDFGDEHIITNKTGDEPKSFLIKNITREKEGKVTINIENEESSLYEYSDYVIFKNIKGMTELNEIKPMKINILSSDKFSIGDTSNYKEYISGGIVKEVFIPIKKKFFSFKDSLFDPFKENLQGQSINLKKGKKELFHACLIAIHYFLDLHKFIPRINNEMDILEIIKSVKFIINFENKKWTKKIKNVDEKYIENIIRYCQCSISPICSFLGGIVSQEIIKITGKYNPISQWLYFDFFEKLDNLDINRVKKPINSRYDEQIEIFGYEFQEKLSNLNLFMIGAGALGCEFLKIFSLMGIGTKEKKFITVTDNDNIELSNLSRQFLFRNKDIGKSKSKISCKEAKKINKKVNFIIHNSKVSYETENIFNDIFWEEQDLIISAVDNEDARRYIDNQSTFYNKIFLECGTSGTSASSMIIYPHKTICYDDLEKVVTNQIPMCTLKSFPFQIEHCIEYSKIYFIEFFEKNIEELISLFEHTDNYMKKISNSLFDKKLLIDKLLELKKLIILYKNKNIYDFIHYALEKFYFFFNKNINDLIKKIPNDSLDENGEIFWKGSKIMPHPILFNINDKLSKNFVFYFCKIYSRILRTDLEINENDILKNYSLIYEKISKENELMYNDIESEKIINNLKSQINLLVKNIHLNKENIPYPEKFEKDNEDSFHVDFVYCFSNLRARNYNIEECDKEKIRKIAGNIIPAIAPTTSTIAGFVAMQIYTILISNDINSMRNIGLDLGTSWYSIGIPEEVKKYKSIDKINNTSNLINLPKNYTIWDTIKIKGPLTCKQIIDLFEIEYNFNIDCINSNNKCLLDLINDSNEELDKTIENLYEECFPGKIKMKKYIKLIIVGNKDNININLPRIKYIL